MDILSFTRTETAEYCEPEALDCRVYQLGLGLRDYLGLNDCGEHCWERLASRPELGKPFSSLRYTDSAEMIEELVQ